MKKLFAVAILTVSALFFFACGNTEKNGSSVKAADGQITWYNFNQGLEMAGAQKKHVIIDFYADWCKWCKVMDKETFQDPKIARKLNDKFIMVKVYMDKENAAPISFRGQNYTAQQFAAAVGVKGLPTLLFMDSQGNLITTIPGYIEKQIFEPLLAYMSSECYRNSISLSDYISGKADCK